MAKFRRMVLALALSATAATALADARVLSGQLKTTLVRIDGGVVSSHGDVDLRIENEAATLGQVSIRCTSGCHAAFSEEIDSSPYSIVAAPDFEKGEEIIVVFSQGATATLVNVYHVTPSAIRSVLRIGTNGGWPSVRTDPGGRPIIVVPEIIDVGAGVRAPDMEQVFRWNGRDLDLTFRPVTKP